MILQKIFQFLLNCDSNYADLNDNPEFKSKVFPGPENSQSASLCFISTAQRGFQHHMRESPQPPTELSIHSEFHSTKQPEPSRVSAPFHHRCLPSELPSLKEIAYQVSILSMQLARGYPRFLGVLCVRSMWVRQHQLCSVPSPTHRNLAC